MIDQTTMGLSDIAFAAGFRSVRRGSTTHSELHMAVRRCLFVEPCNHIGPQIELNLLTRRSLYHGEGPLKPEPNSSQLRMH
jgi:hypothetical protein